MINKDREEKRIFPCHRGRLIDAMAGDIWLSNVKYDVKKKNPPIKKIMCIPIGKTHLNKIIK